MQQHLGRRIPAVLSRPAAIMPCRTAGCPCPWLPAGCAEQFNAALPGRPSCQRTPHPPALPRPPPHCRQIKKRLVVAPPAYVIKVITKDGIKEVKRITG